MKTYLIPIGAVFATLISFPLFQQDIVDPVVTALRDLPALGTVVWIVFWLQNKHQETVKAIMTEFVKRETAKDETSKDTIDALLRVIEKSTK